MSTSLPPDEHLLGEMAWRIGFGLIPLGALAAVLWVLGTQELPVAVAFPWIPGLGIEAAFRIDGLSALMLLMITGIGVAVFVYAGGYLHGHPGLPRLYVLLTAFMVAMIGCVTADHVLVLFVFWELTSLLSFLLVGFDHERPASRKSAQQALMVTGTGGLVLLAGLLMLSQQMGTGSIPAILQQLPDAPRTPELTAAMVLIIIGAFTKSAQFPFHFWLPNAMAAPTPVSAYLHSATMVKLGVYLLARLDPGFGQWPLWELLLKSAGSITAAWGMVLALQERDLKRILAWSTVATLGTLVMLVGLRGESASVAMGALMLAHGLYKAPLFFVAGNVDHAAGTRVIDHLSGLRRAMPWTAAAALLAGASMAGMPLSFGYIAKDVLMQAKAAEDVFAFAEVANAVFGSIAVAVAAVAAIRVFWSRPSPSSATSGQDLHEGGLALVGPPLAVACIGMGLGLFPYLAEDLLSAASVAMTPGTEAFMRSLSLADALGTALGSLIVTLVIGLAIFMVWDPLHRVVDAFGKAVHPVAMISVYERSLAGIPRVAARVTRIVQTGHLPGHFAWLAGASTLALWAAVWWVLVGTPLGALVWNGLGGAGDAPIGFIGGCLAVVAGALAGLFARDRLVLLLVLGLVGYGSAVVFLFAGAPDVALTQLTVETVFVVVAAAVLLRLQRSGRAQSAGSPNEGWGWRMPLAAAFGLGVAALVLLTSAGPLDPALSQFFAEASVPEAQGRNVVNVILVDFRALDTLGEITVVMLSLLAAHALLKVRRAPPKP